MGWSAESNYRFDFKGMMLTQPDPVWGLRHFRDPGVYRTRRSSAKLSELLGRRRKFTYKYDWSSYGGDWEHNIVVEKTITAEPEAQYPVCVSGACASPPEHSGFSWGYHQLLQVKAAADPEEAAAKARKYISRYRAPWLPASQTEPHVNLMRWLETFDPDKFDPEEINEALSAYSQMGFRYFQ
jgi:hypothetical protein